MVFYNIQSVPNFVKVFNNNENETEGEIKNEAGFILSSKNIA
jgi:hypothetical protein